MPKRQSFKLLGDHPADDDRGWRESTIEVTQDFDSLSWRNYYRAAELTERIDFGCDFKNGRCKKHRRDKEPMCCCQYCAVEGGYLHKVSAAGAKVVQKLWDKKTGLWRKGKGCILPRRYRSITCLLHSCSFPSLFESLFRDLMERHIEKTMRNHKDLGRLRIKNFPKALKAVELGLEAEGLLKK